MVADPDKVWLGLEYFCNEGDELWRRTDEELIELGREELHRIGIIDQAEVLDGTVIRMEKTYPAYFGAYDRFDEIRQYRGWLRESVPGRAATACIATTTRTTRC